MPHDALLWSRWGSDCVLYQRASGQTHFVNLATFHLLHEILQVPRDLEGATRELASLQDVAVDPEFAGQVGAVLLRLEQLGLVERVAG